MGIALTLTGCVSYQAPNIPEEQLAYIEEVKEFNGFNKVKRIDIKKINDISARTYWQDFSEGSADINTFAIAPGPCHLDVYYHGSIWQAAGEITFNAEAGGKYQVGCLQKVVGERVPSVRVIFYIIDIETGQPVSFLPKDLSKEVLNSLAEKSNNKSSEPVN